MSQTFMIGFLKSGFRIGLFNNSIANTCPIVIYKILDQECEKQSTEFKQSENILPTL